MTDDQLFSVIFNKGLSYKSDPKTQVVNAPTRLENLVFDELSTVRMRDGYGNIASATAANTKQLSTRVTEALLEDANGLSALAANGLNLKNDYWQAADASDDAPWERATCQIDSVTSPGQALIFETDHASLTGYECFAWAELAGAIGTNNYTLRAALRDTSTGSVVAQSTLASGLGMLPHPRVVASGTKFFVYWATFSGTGQIKYSSLDTASVLTFAAGANVGVLANGNHTAFDAYAGNGGISFAYTSGAGHLIIGRLSASDGHTVTATFQDTTIPLDGSISVCQVASSLTGRTIDVAAYSDNGSGTLYVTKLDNGAFNTSANSGLVGLGLVAVIPDPVQDQYGTVRVFYEINPGYDASEAWPVDVVQAAYTLSAAGSPPNGGGNHPVTKGVCLAGRPIYTGPAHANSLKNIYVPVAQAHTADPPTQPTVFLMALSAAPDFLARASAVVTSKILPGESGFTPSSQGNSHYLTYRLPTCVADSTGNIVNLASLRNGKFLLSNGAVYWAQIVTIARVDLAGTQNSVEVGGALFLAGGCPSYYDGQQVVEAGFNMFPEFPVGYAPVQATGGSLTLVTTYGIVFLYEWTDAIGKLHRSAASVPLSVTLTGSNTKITVKVPYLRLTRKYGVRIACYRTEGNGTIYYRDTSTGTDASNNPSSNGILSFVCTTSDASLRANEILYTTGGALPNQAFPSASRACLHQRRVVMALDSDPYMIQYTDELDDATDAQGTNPVYQLPVSSTYGKICWLDSMDDKLIIGCERGVLAVFGSGPDRLGNQNSFTLPQCAVSGFGARFGHPNAHVLTPDGIWFLTGINNQSDADGVQGSQGPGGGVRFLTRNLTMGQTQSGGYLGAEIDSIASRNFNGYAVRALKRPGKQQYYFQFGTQAAAVFDQQWGNWSTFTGFAFVDIAASADSLICAPLNGALKKHNGSYTNDSGDDFQGILETGWLMPGNILQGYQRVKRLQVATTQESGGTGPIIVIALAFDDSTSFTETSGLGGSVDPVVDYEHHLQRQKCKALKVRITVAKNSQSADSGGLTGLTFRVGIKKGLNKIPSSQRI